MNNGLSSFTVHKDDIKNAKTNIPNIDNRDNYQRYLNEITKFKVLSPKEEKKLFARIKKNDQSAIDLVIKHNLKFVISVAKIYSPTIRNNALTLEDLVNEGNIGLILAVKGFDHKKGFKFISFAVNHIRQHMINAIRNNIKTVRIPQNRQVIIHKLKKIEEDLERALERRVDDVEIFEEAKKHGIINKKHNHLFVDSVRKDITFELSLNLPLTFNRVGDDTTLLDILENHNVIDPIENNNNKEISKFLDRIIEKRIPNDVKQMFTLYFGLDGNEAKQLTEISKIMNLTQRHLSYKIISYLKILKERHAGEYNFLTK